MAATVIDLSAIQPDSLYPPELAAPLTGKTPKTLANDRCARRGLPFHRIGAKPFYLGRDIIEGIEASRVAVHGAPQKLARNAKAA